MTLQPRVCDADFKQLNVDSTFHPFGSKPPVPILDNYTIVWRLVDVLTEPNSNLRVKSAMKKDFARLNSM